MLKYFKRHRMWVTAVSVAALFGSAYFSYNLGDKVSKLSILKEGLATCTNRLTQSYTSKVMGTGGEYVSDSFFSTTEECLADVKKIAEASDIKLIRDEIKELSTLTSNAYWFHKALSSAQLSEIDGFRERFDKVETSRIEFEETLALAQSSISGPLFFQKINLIVLGLITFVLIGWELSDKRKKRLANELFELTARDYAQNGSFGDRAKRLITDALEYNELTECSRLFSAIDTRDRRFDRLRDSSDLEIVCEIAPDLNIELEMEPIIEVEFEAEEDTFTDDSVWRDEFAAEEVNPELMGMSHKIPERVISKPEIAIEPQQYATDVESIFNRVSDLFQDRLNGLNVLLDVRGDEKVLANISVENLTQALYSLFSDSIKRFATGKQNKIVFFIRKFEGKAHFSYMDNGAPLDFESLDLTIAKEIFEESRVQVHMENSDDFGGHIALVSELGFSEKSQKRLVSVKKTTKRELLKSLGA